MSNTSMLTDEPTIRILNKQKPEAVICISCVQWEISMREVCQGVVTCIEHKEVWEHGYTHC
jgi:hypothetical protein